MRTLVLSLVLGCASSTAAPGPVEAGAPPKAIAANASEGERDLAKIIKPLADGVRAQPYGKAWDDLQPATKAPKDKRGVGGAASHEGLEHDTIEIQQQVQFLEETKVEARYGWVSLRIMRQYRFGKVAGAQIVIERIGKDDTKKAAFEADLAALSAAWKDPGAVLGLTKDFVLKRNDLAPLAKELPLRVVFEPGGPAK